MGSGGSKPKQQVAEYRLSAHIGFCYSVDALLHIYVKEKKIFDGVATGNTTIPITLPKLFGGVKKEGGLDGEIHVLQGRSDQTLSDRLKGKLSADSSIVPGFRGVLSLFFTEKVGSRPGFLWTANSPYLHTIWAKAKRIRNNGDQWYPEKAGIFSLPEIPTVSWSQVTGTSTDTTAQPISCYSIESYGGTVAAGFGLGRMAISGDNGTTWTWTTAHGFGSGATKSVRYGGGVWLVAGDNGQMSRSPDLVSWSTISSPFGTSSVNAVCYADGVWIAVGSNGKIARSIDGAVTWTLVTSGVSTTLGDVAYDGKSRLIVVGNAGVMLTSTDLGASWATVASPFSGDQDVRGIAFGNEMWVSGGGNLSVGAVAYSHNGTVWQLGVSTGGDFSNINDIKLYDGVFVAAGELWWTMGAFYPRVLISADGENWEVQSDYNAIDQRLTCIAAGDGVWIAGVAEQTTSKNMGSIIRASSFVVARDEDMNPAHIVRECLTNTDWGMGLPAGSLDDASFTEAADRLYAEKFGLSLMWSGQTEIQSFVNEVLGHIDGTYGIDPATGKFYIKLIRGGYDTETLPVLNDDNCRITNFNRKALGETTNEIVVTWTNPESEQEETVVVHDLANYASQGALVSSSRNFYGIRNSKLALRAAMRELGKASQPLATFEVEVNRSAWSWKSGDVVKVSSSEYGINELPCRVTSINYGKPGAMTIRVSLIEDVFSMPDDAYVEQNGSLWTDEATEATVTDVRILTAPYFAVAKASSDADAEAVSYPDCYNLVLATGTGSLAEIFSPVSNSVDETTYESFGSIEMAGKTTLAGALVKTEVTSSVSFSTITGTVYPASGVFCLIGSSEETAEIAVVESVIGSTVTIRRGMLDTVPSDWPVGTVVWLFNWDSDMSDNQSNVVGSTVSYRVAPDGGEGYGYRTAEVTYNDRMYRPFRPANVKVNATSYPTSVTGNFTVSWSNRNRLSETASPLLWSAASVTPEDGQTTSIAIRRTDTNALVASSSGLSGTSQNFLITYTGDILIEVFAKRSGYNSWQSFTHSFNYSPGGAEFSPVILGVASALNTAATTSHVIVLPEDRVPGDLILAIGGVRSSDTITSPSGWTGGSFLTSGGTHQVRYFYRVVDGSEPASISFASATSCVSAFRVYRIQAGTFATDSTGAPVFMMSATPYTASSVGPVVTRWYWENKNTLSVGGGVFLQTTSNGSASALSFPDNQFTDNVPLSSGLMHSAMTKMSNGVTYPESASMTLDSSREGRVYNLALRGVFDPSEAEIRFVSASNKASVSTDTITIPTSAKIGDTVILIGLSTTSVMNTPAGWTSVTTGTRMRAVKNTLVSGDVGASVALSWGSSGNTCVVTYVISGSSSDGTAEVSAVGTGTGTSATAPAFTASSAYDGRKNMLLTFVYHNTAPTSNVSTFPQPRQHSQIFNLSSGGVAISLCHGPVTGANVSSQAFGLVTSTTWYACNLLVKGV